ncbi:MAG: hypothetical protein BRD37_03825 [Bacteroidetes bacterium QH_8_67_23]|nr:MAG: hypothetical protein BRD37_03825 [Bacteroidetes bacterium QH_8_67_23]
MGHYACWTVEAGVHQVGKREDGRSLRQIVEALDVIPDVIYPTLPVHDRNPSSGSLHDMMPDGFIELAFHKQSERFHEGGFLLGYRGTAYLKASKA